MAISCYFLYLFLLRPQKKEAKKSGFFADMNAARSVHLLTAAAKVNWTLTRFRTPLYEAGHSHRFRTACRHFPRTQRHGMMQALRFAGPDKRIAVVKPLHRLRPRRGRILLTPDERSVIWGGKRICHPLPRCVLNMLRSTEHAHRGSETS